MPIINVSLSDEFERFISAEVESGRYQNASEVIAAALRVLEREKENDKAKLAALRAAIDEGERGDFLYEDPAKALRQSAGLERKTT